MLIQGTHRTQFFFKYIFYLDYDFYFVVGIRDFRDRMKFNGIIKHDKISRIESQAEISHPKTS